MSDKADVQAQRVAAEYLRQLLLKPGGYRDAWQRQVARPRDGVINQLAVAEVIVAHLRSAPDRPADRHMMPYQLRDVVSDALSGRHLSMDSIALFAGAFGFSGHESDRLRCLRMGSARIGVFSGSQALPAERELTDVLGPRKHQTLSLHDHVYVGADGRIDRARMLQVVEAIQQGVDRIPFLCDTNVLTIEVGKGGKELSGEVRQLRQDVFFTEILLSRTLDLGETHALEYWLTYRFPGDLTDQTECEFRRAVMRQVANLEMRIEFDPDRLPARVWWAHWDGVDGAVVDREAVTLDWQHSAHRYVQSVDKTVIGFQWSWEPDG